MAEASPQLVGRARLITASGLGWMFDAMDVLMLSYIVAYLGGLWGWGSSERAIVILANNLGLLAGAALFGYLADSLGRRRVFMITMLIYSLLAALQGLVRSPLELAAVRFFMGLGLGGELPVAATMVSELSRPGERGRNVVLLESFWAYGVILAGAVFVYVVPSIGYTPTMFLLSLTALYVVVLRRALPEPPRGLGTASKPPLAELVRSSGRILPFIWAAWFSIAFGYYGVFLWLPSYLARERGLGVATSIEYTFLTTLAQVPGYFSAAYLVERIGRRPTFLIYMMVSAAAALGLGAASSREDLLLWGSAVSFFNLGAWGVIYAYTPELFPERYRATGAGSCGSVARVGMIVGPSIPAMAGSFAASLTTFSAVWAAGALALLMTPETRAGRREVAARRL